MRERSGRVYRLMAYLFMVEGEKEGLHFTTLFARMAYFISKFKVSTSLARALHLFRIREETSADDDVKADRHFWNGVFALASVLSHFSEKPIDGRIASAIPQDAPFLDGDSSKGKQYRRLMRFIATAVDEDGHTLLGFVENGTSDARLNVADAGRSDLYRENIAEAIDILGLPMTLSLVDVEADSAGLLSPRMIVVEPDLSGGRHDGGRVFHK